MGNVWVQTLDAFHTPPWGTVTHLKLYTPEYKRLNWVQVWQAFTDVYPDRWAIELYPPAEELINDAHVYHLWLLPEGWRPPSSMNLGQSSGRSLATTYRG